MSVREFVGARYVPIFVGEWDNTRTYEPLMVVTYQGASYTSRQYVPAGIEITNESYWVLSANYNAQVEAYRKEVQAFDGRIAVNANSISAETTRAESAEQTLQTSISDKMCSNDVAICSPEFIMDGTGAQGFCCKKINGNVHFWLAKYASSSSVTIYHYVNGSKFNEATFSTLGHANQICYADGKLYVAGVGLTDDAPISVIDAQTLKMLSTIDIHVYALDYYDGHFYAISGGDRFVRKYKPDFSSYEELHIDWANLDVGQTICVWDNGIIVLQNQYDPNIGWVNVLQFFGKNGAKQKLMTTQTCDEIEQICFNDGMFMCASNALEKIIVSSINVNGYNGSATYTEKMFYYAKSNIIVPDRIVFYVDYSASEFGDGSESRPWNSIVPIVNMSEYFPQIKILFKGDSYENLSLYNGCKKVTVECIDSDRKRAPRVNSDFSVKYVNCIYDKVGFSSDCTFTFDNCVICPSSALFTSSSAESVLFNKCIFDYTNGPWKVLNDTATRPISIRNLSLKGDGTTEYDRNSDIGCHAKVYCNDVLSSIVFMIADVGLSTPNQGTIDKCFTWGVNQCGFYSNASNDAYFNLSAASPNRCLQYKIGSDSTIKHRFVSGCQKITIDSSGNVNYPNLVLGEWQ